MGLITWAIFIISMGVTFIFGVELIYKIAKTDNKTKQTKGRSSNASNL